MYNSIIKKSYRKRRKTYNARSEMKLYIYLNQVKTEKNKKTLRNYQIVKLTI